MSETANTNLKYNIMMVDDEADMLSTIGGMLKDAGYDVRLASDESEAIIKRGEKPIDLLVVDLCLRGDSGHGESGLKLAQDFHAYDSNIRIIILTGSGNRQNIIRAFRDMKVNDFIEKSPDMGKNLLASIQKLSQNIKG